MEHRFRLLSDLFFFPATMGGQKSAPQSPCPKEGMLGHEEVLKGGHFSEELKILKGPRYTQARDIMGRMAKDVYSSKKDFPFLRVIEATETIKDRRLAGSIGTDEPVNSPFLNFEMEVIDRH
jgi:hypothetical protein